MIILWRLFRTLLVCVVAAALTTVVFLISLERSRAPQSWTAVILAVVCFAIALFSRVPRRNLIWWNCTAVLLAWGLFDAVAVYRGGDAIQPVSARFFIAFGLHRFLPQELDAYDPFLGKVNAPNAHEVHGELRETTDAYGLRISPPAVVGVTPERCVLFFGCSYTFGVGVSDTETFAYLVESKTGGHVRSRNFGIGAGGPHNALALLEAGFVERGAQCSPTHAFFLFIPHHVVRSAGKSIVRFGPEYALQTDGSIARVGTLNRTALGMIGDVLRYTSGLYVLNYGYDGDLQFEDLVLTAGILRTFGAQLAKTYPGIEFHILYWDDPPLPAIVEQLRTVGVPVHNISSIIPKLADGYLPGDSHPNLWAHDRIAEYIVTSVLKEPRIASPALGTVGGAAS